MLGVLVIKFDAFANFCCSYANDGIGVGIVVGWPVEYFHAQHAFLKLIRLPRQEATDNKSEEARIALTGVKQRGRKQLFQLLLNRGLFAFVRGGPTIGDWLW